MTATAKMSHTAEPWRVDKHERRGDFDIHGMVDQRIYRVATSSIKADATRIVACVNACAGMADPVALIAEIRKELDGIVYDLGRIALNNVDQTAQAQRTLEGASALLAKLGEG